MAGSCAGSICWLIFNTCSALLRGTNCAAAAPALPRSPFWATVATWRYKLTTDGHILTDDISISFLWTVSPRLCSASTGASISNNLRIERSQLARDWASRGARGIWPLGLGVATQNITHLSPLTASRSASAIGGASQPSCVSTSSAKGLGLALCILDMGCDIASHAATGRVRHGCRLIALKAISKGAVLKRSTRLSFCGMCAYDDTQRALAARPWHHFLLPAKTTPSRIPPRNLAALQRMITNFL